MNAMKNHIKQSTLLIVLGMSIFSVQFTVAETMTSREELVREWSQAIEKLESYSADRRDIALAEAKKMLRSMDNEIGKLEAQAQDEWQDMNKDLRKTRREALYSLRLQRQKIAEWYGAMQHSSSDAWEEIKQGFVKAYDDLGNAFNNAADEFES